MTPTPEQIADIEAHIEVAKKRGFDGPPWLHEALSALLASWRELMESEKETRRFLFFLCPHPAKYGDDGEMQCTGARPWDFQRNDIGGLREHVLGALQDHIASLRRQLEEAHLATAAAVANRIAIEAQLAERDKDVERLRGAVTNEEGVKALADLCGFDEKRCDVCSWPLASKLEDGCTLGSCSFRGDDAPAMHKHSLTKARQAFRHLISEARKVERVRVHADGDEADTLDAGERQGYLWALHDLKAILSAPDAEPKEASE